MKTIFRLLDNETWFIIGGHAISSLRIGSPYSYFDTNQQQPVAMDSDQDVAILMPSQEHYEHVWAPLFRKQIQTLLPQVHIQSKIYKSNHLKIFKTTNTKKRVIYTSHNVGHISYTVFIPLFPINSTHVTTNLKKRRRKKISTSLLIPPRPVLYGPNLQAYVPRRNEGLTWFDSHFSKKECPLALPSFLYNISTKLKHCSTSSGTRSGACPSHLKTLKYFSKRELNRHLKSCSQWLQGQKVAHFNLFNCKLHRKSNPES